MEIYKNLTFPQKAHIFECFLLENSEFPKTNPPYFASISPKMSKQVIYIVTCLLGYPTNQWVDEAVLGFLSVFSYGHKPSLIFNYSQYL